MVEENKYLIFDHKMPRFEYMIRFACAQICKPYYALMFNLAKPKRFYKKQNYVSICAIFKDESAYLKEWIEYHLMIGVDHFYLYNNCSSDSYLEVLSDYINRGKVTLKDWNIPQGQMAAYNDCYNSFHDETNWIAFIDLDEYIVPNISNDIKDFLKKYESNRPVIVSYWRYFGSSGIIHREPNSILIEEFTRCWGKYADIGKYFFNTSYEYDQSYKRNGAMHTMWGKIGHHMLPPINCYGKQILFGINSVPDDNPPLQINHYVIKSYEEYVQKKIKRGGGVHAVGFHNMDYFWKHDEKCNSADYKISRFITKLKLCLEEHKDVEK